MPASIAAIKGSCAMDYSGLRVDVVECGLERGEGTVDGECNGCVHFLRHLRREFVGLRAAQDAALDQGAAKAWNRVAPQRCRVLLGLTENRDRFVLRVVQRHTGRSDDVAVRRKAVDLRLDQRWAAAGPRALD